MEVGKGVEGMGTSAIVSIIKIKLKKVKHRINIQLKNFTPRFTPKELKMSTCRCMLIAALFKIDRRCKYPKYPSTEEQINCDTSYTQVHTVEYYSTIKRNEVQIMLSWLNLQNIIRKKPDIKGQILYDSIYMKYPNQYVHKDGTQISGCRGPRGGEKLFNE